MVLPFSILELITPLTSEIIRYAVYGAIILITFVKVKAVFLEQKTKFERKRRQHQNRKAEKIRKQEDARKLIKKVKNEETQKTQKIKCLECKSIFYSFNEERLCYVCSKNRSLF